MKMCSPEPLRGRTCCPAVKGAMGRVPPAACSFRVCLSCVEPDALLTAMLFPGKPTFGEWARRAFKDPDLSTHSGMTLMGNIYSTVSCQVGLWVCITVWLFPLLNPASSPSFNPLYTPWTQILSQCLHLENSTCDMASFGYKGFKYLSALIFGFLSWFRAQVGKQWCRFQAPLGSSSRNNSV